MAVAKEQDEDDHEPGASGERLPVVRFQAGRYDRDSVHTAVRSDPELAHILARDILEAEAVGGYEEQRRLTRHR